MQFVTPPFLCELILCLCVFVFLCLCNLFPMHVKYFYLPSRFCNPLPRLYNIVPNLLFLLPSLLNLLLRRNPSTPLRWPCGDNDGVDDEDTDDKGKDNSWDGPGNSDNHKNNNNTNKQSTTANNETGFDHADDINNDVNHNRPN